MSFLRWWLLQTSHHPRTWSLGRRKWSPSQLTGKKPLERERQRLGLWAWQSQITGEKSSPPSSSFSLLFTSPSLPSPAIIAMHCITSQDHNQENNAISRSSVLLETSTVTWKVSFSQHTVPLGTFDQHALPLQTFQVDSRVDSKIKGNL